MYGMNKNIQLKNKIINVYLLRLRVDVTVYLYGSYFLDMGFCMTRQWIVELHNGGHFEKCLFKSCMKNNSVLEKF